MEKTYFDIISKYISLSGEEKCKMEALKIFHSLKKETILLKEGQYSNKSYLVLQGCIRTYYIIDGEEKTTALFTEMERLSPNCVLNKKPSKHFISCIEDSILAITDHNDEKEIYKKVPKIKHFFRVHLEYLLAKSQYSLDEFKTSSPEQRYISLIKNRPELLNRVPQHQLASYLGVTPQSLSRIRSRIRKENS